MMIYQKRHHLRLRLIGLIIPHIEAVTRDSRHSPTQAYFLLIIQTLNLGEYIKVTSGNNCKRLTSVEECEEAARQLGLSDTEAQQIKGLSSQPFCYLYHTGTGNSRGAYLKFNKISNASAPCNSDRICICRRGKREC